ncbi:MAG TPA: iron uptake transporter permease EfeU [Mycobacteriales bacterium]|nr:iron uptake transporter permease EfeU [Mycobacteriales bacterium]
MLPTFVIGLREGLEAALIVGIIAAFLRKQGRRDLLRWVFVGVGTAIALCVAVGVALEVLSRDLPQQQQEGLETVVGALAVAMVTYMVVWMRKHSRELKGTLEGAAAQALATGSNRATTAMVLMAFLAVLREGFETVVFLLAAFNESGSGVLAGVGAALGIAVAIGLGWGIYRGGVTLNLAKFFRATGLVLVLVAAGLVVTALHTAHEAGWLNAGQGSTIDLSWLVHPGSVRSSLLTGMLGVQPHPVVIEVVGWLVYVVPVALFVTWPAGRSIGPRALAILTGAGAVAAGVTALALLATAPATPASGATSSVTSGTASVISADPTSAVVRFAPLGSTAATTLSLHRDATITEDGVTLLRYTRRDSHADTSSGLPATLTDREVASRSGGRLPLGIVAGRSRIPVTYTTTTTTTALIEPTTLRVVSGTRSTSTTATVHSAGGQIPLDHAVRTTAAGTPAAVVARQLATVRADLTRSDQRADRRSLAAFAGALAVALALAATVVLLRRRRTPRLDSSAGDLVRHKVRLT